MQLNKSASPKIPSSMRRSGRYTQFSFASFLSLIVFCYAPPANAANWACTQDMTPVNLSIEDASDTLKYLSGSGTKLTIPKSYIIDPDQWSGGRQQLVVVGIDASDMSPVCKNHSRKIGLKFNPDVMPSPDLSHENAIWVIIHPTNAPPDSDPVGRLIELYRKTYTELLSENDQGFAVYKNHLSPKYQDETMLIPLKNALPQKVMLKCISVIGKEQHRGCEAYTYENGEFRYSYNFKAIKWLGDFPNLDSKIRKLLDQFLELK